ncbi:unnamed protein product [Linum trigynum]|uniref:Uncharacterized protein n=1 Tax=Linum trigynum TaxID=586398 RepID=A0AAV2G2L9_9ROSI
MAPKQVKSAAVAPKQAKPQKEGQKEDCRPPKKYGREAMEANKKKASHATKNKNNEKKPITLRRTEKGTSGNATPSEDG